MFTPFLALVRKDLKLFFADRRAAPRAVASWESPRTIAAIPARRAARIACQYVSSCQPLTSTASNLPRAIVEASAGVLQPRK